MHLSIVLISKNNQLFSFFLLHWRVNSINKFTSCCKYNDSILRVLAILQKLILCDWLWNRILWLLRYFQLRLQIPFQILSFIIIIFRISEILNVELRNHVDTFAGAALTFTGFPIDSKRGVLALGSKIFSSKFTLLTFLSIYKSLGRRILSAVSWIDVVKKTKPFIFCNNLIFLNNLRNLLFFYLAWPSGNLFLMRFFFFYVLKLGLP